MTDTFELYDLRVTIEGIRGHCSCDHVLGDFFEVRGGKLYLPAGQSFCLFALQSTCRCFRETAHPAPNDWMTTDTRVVCPDPLCGTIMRIDRVQRRVVHHAD